jgi:hypothetical protein
MPWGIIPLSHYVGIVVDTDEEKSAFDFKVYQAAGVLSS